METNNLLWANMKILKTALAAIIATSLAGCGSVNEFAASRSETVEMYHIFDIKTQADTSTVAKAAANGLARNTNRVESAMPLQLGKVVPDEPGRFTLTDMSSMLSGQTGALLKMAGASGGNIALKTANCDGAVWTAKAVRDVSGYNRLTLHTCLYKYKSGYNLDMYAVFNKQTGGLYEISRRTADAIVGTPEAWVEKTIQEMLQAVEAAANAKAVHVEGQPELGSYSAAAAPSRG